MLYFYALDRRIWKRWEALAPRCQESLSKQQFTVAGPGTILKDVETLIEFVGSEGIVTQSRNASLPVDRLPELNRRSSYPVQLQLKRAMLRDYPNLSGIFILLRVMELLQVSGRRLIVCPSALDFWRGLNPTEQYFSLLEALLFQAQTTVLGGERTREEAQAFRMTAVFLGQLSDHWRNFSHYESESNLGLHGELPPWALFVQRQLGLIEIRPLPLSKQERGRGGGRGWLTGGARLTAWGTAVTWALLGFWKSEVVEESEAEAEESDQQESDEESDESPDDESVEAEFGNLQPVFQPNFPEWRTVYMLPARKVRAGAHTFKVTLAGRRGVGGSIWRRFVVPPDTSLDDLAAVILRAFKLDDDHAYDFRYRDQRGKRRVYNHPWTDQGPFTPEIAVAETELAIKDEMKFTFDYGDYWEFQVRLEAVDAGPCRLGEAKVIESAGIAPEQYPQSGFLIASR